MVKQTACYVGTEGNLARYPSAQVSPHLNIKIWREQWSYHFISHVSRCHLLYDYIYHHFCIFQTVSNCCIFSSCRSVQVHVTLTDMLVTCLLVPIYCVFYVIVVYYPIVIIKILRKFFAMVHKFPPTSTVCNQNLFPTTKRIMNKKETKPIRIKRMLEEQKANLLHRE